MRTSGAGLLRLLTDRAAELLYPSATYCIVCGNFIDSSRAYCICDHCIRRIEWGNIRVDTEAERRSEASRDRGRSMSSLREKIAAEAYNETPLAELQAAYRSEAWELPNSVQACFGYGLYGRRVVFELKYNGHSYVARVGAHIMADRVCTDPAAAVLLSCDFAAAVPVSRQRLRQRGFNQAEKLAKYFCAETGMCYVPKLLLRMKDTEALRRLSPQERYMSLENAFALNSRSLRRISQGQEASLENAFALNSRSLRRVKQVQEHSLENVFALNSRSLPQVDKSVRTDMAVGQDAENTKNQPLRGKRILLIDDIYTTGATAKHCTQLLRKAGASEVHMLVLTTGSDFAINENTSQRANAMQVRGSASHG